MGNVSPPLGMSGQPEARVVQAAEHRLRQRLYVCDLDGTLLRSDATLSEFSRRGLNTLIEDGAQITVASARSSVAMRSLLRGVSLRLPVIELDGGFISDLATGRHLVQRLLSTSLARITLSTLARTGHDPVLTTFDGADDHVYFSPRLNAGTRWYVDEKHAYGDPRLRPTDDLGFIVATEQTATVTAFVPTDEADAVLAQLSTALGAEGSAGVSGAPHPHVPEWTELRVAHPGANKGSAVRTLLSMLDLVGVEVVACGDHLNDLTMFSVADLTVAPANALAEVQARADVIVEANDADGVVRFLKAEHASSPSRGV